MYIAVYCEDRFLGNWECEKNEMFQMDMIAIGDDVYKIHGKIVGNKLTVYIDGEPVTDKKFRYRSVDFIYEDIDMIELTGR